MNVTWICPTYGRPRMACHALSCFLSQDYPEDKLRMVIFDDLGSFAPPDCGELPRVCLKMSSVRCPSLPNKYNRLWTLAASDPSFHPDVIVVCEDDDDYLPWHTSSIVEALKDGGEWVHPERVLSDYAVKPGEPLNVEGAAGRFHASLAIRTQALGVMGGWIETDRGTFDQEFIQALRARFGPAKVPQVDVPSYIFRWHTTGALHGQSLMARHGEDWYRKYPVIDDKQTKLEPKYDATTASYFRRYAGRLPVGQQV